MSSDPLTPDQRVAVVVRTRNRPVLLRRALSSISAQTHPDLEVVIVNDGGDPAPVQALVADLLPEERAEVQVVHHATSHGRAAALNAGLAAGSAPLVAVHDDDDSWDPAFLTRTVAHLAEHPADMGVAARTEVVFEHVHGLGVVEDRREILSANTHAITLYDMVRRDYAPPISVLYRRRVHEVTGPYDESLPVLEDWDFMLRLISRFPVGFVDGAPLAFWHQRPDATGEDSNSVASQSGEHQRWDTTVRDAWLRRDIAAGTGLGTLMHLVEALDRDRRLAGDRAGALGDAVSLLHHHTNTLSEQVTELSAELRRQGETLERLHEEAKHAALRDDRTAELLTRGTERLGVLDQTVQEIPGHLLRSIRTGARRALRLSR